MSERTTIIYVRHGQTDWNKNLILQGRIDTELNATGKKQAKDIAKEVAKYKADVVFSSPLKRAYDTAKIINPKGKIITDERLMEICHGTFEDCPYPLNYYDIYNIKTPDRYGMGENIYDVKNRVWPLLQEIVEEYAGKTILIVGHAGTGRLITAFFWGVPSSGTYNDYAMANCEIREFHHEFKAECANQRTTQNTLAMGG